MKITSFDRNQISTVNEDVKRALESVAAKHGITFKMGNIRFNDSNFSAKFEMAVIGDNGQAVNKMVTDFERYRAVKGIQASIGDLLVSGGRRFEVAGYKAGSSKYPIIVNCLDDGKQYKMSVEQCNRNII